MCSTTRVHSELYSFTSVVVSRIVQKVSFMSVMFTCLQVILRHSGIDYLMISRAKLILVVLGGKATLEILETKWVLPKTRPGRPRGRL